MGNREYPTEPRKQRPLDMGLEGRTGGRVVEYGWLDHASKGEPLTRLRQLGPLTDDNLLIFRDRTPKGRHYTERPGAPPTRLQDSSFGAGCFGNAKSS